MLAACPPQPGLGSVTYSVAHVRHVVDLGSCLTWTVAPRAQFGKPRVPTFRSPDGRAVAFVRVTKREQTIVVRRAGRARPVLRVGEVYRVVDDDHGPIWLIGWSPDSRWLAYARPVGTGNFAIFLYDTKAAKLHQATSGYLNDRQPAFDPEGKYLYYASDRAFDPVYGTFDNTWTYANPTELVVVPLRADVKSPLAARNDAENPAIDTDKHEEKDKKADEKPPEKPAAPSNVDIDLDRFEARGVVLPPPGELQAFIADTSPSKRISLVDRLLADRAKYAEHWISFWNDLLRNDEGVNYYSETASRKSITEWLLAALESNLPYNRFVGKLLNPAAPQDPDGFLIGVNWRGEVSASQTPAMQAAQNTAQVFLGLNLKCNSCHDSFISRWKLKDAYGLASFFSEQPQLQLYRCDVAQNQYAEPRFLFPELNRAPQSDSPADRRSAAAAIFTDPRNGRLPRTLVNRIWHRLFGRGIVDNPDEMDGEPWSPALLDWLAADFVDHGYDPKHLLATLASSRAYQMRAVPRSVAVCGMTLSAEPAWNWQIEMRPDLIGSTLRDTIDCNAVITCAPTRTESMQICGRAAWPPSPMILMSASSVAAITGPERIANEPTGIPGPLCMP